MALQRLCTPLEDGVLIHFETIRKDREPKGSRSLFCNSRSTEKGEYLQGCCPLFADTLAYHLKEHHGSSGRDIEGLDVADHRDR